MHDVKSHKTTIRKFEVVKGENPYLITHVNNSHCVVPFTLVNTTLMKVIIVSSLWRHGWRCCLCLIWTLKSPFLFFANVQLDELFCILIYDTSLRISSIIMLITRRSNCINTSSGMISLCVSDCLVCRSGGRELLTGIPSSHSHRLIVPDDVLTRFDLLMVSTLVLEICR